MTNFNDALNTLKADVNANGDAVQAAITAFRGIADALKAAASNLNNDEAASEINDLATELANQSASLGTSVINNTPAASPNTPATGSPPAASQPATTDAPPTPPAAADGTPTSAAAPATTTTDSGVATPPSDGSSLSGPGA